MTEAARSIGSYFFSVSVIPSIVLVSGAWLIVASGAFSSEGPTVGAVVVAITAASPGTLLALSLAAFVFALLTHPFQIALVKLAEGYTDALPMRPVNEWGLARHYRRQLRTEQQILSIRQARRNEMSDRAFVPTVYAVHRDVKRVLSRRRSTEDQLLLANLEARRSSMPDPDRAMPSRLGNELRSGEDRAGHRYGLLGVSVSAHLAVVGPEAADDLAAYQTTMERQIRLAFNFVGMAFFALVAFGNDGPWLFVGPLLMVGGVLSYEGAVRAGSIYGEQTQVIADLHRRDLLRAMHFPEPEDLDDERWLLGVLSAQITDDLDPDDRREINRRLQDEARRARSGRGESSLRRRPV